jgi:molybdate transport system substrate-binding protein
MTHISRRACLLGAGTIAVSTSGVRAAPWATEVGVYTEPTLAPAVRAAGRFFTARHGAGVAVLTAPAPLLLEQIQHNAAHDVLIVPAAFMDQAVARGYVRAESRRDAWHDDLVIAAAAGASGGQDARALLGRGTIAVTDPTVAATLDGRAVLDGLGLGVTAHVQGVGSTADAAFMVAQGTVKLGLVYVTDVRANPALSVAAILAAAPVVFAMGMNPAPPSRNAQAFMDFLATDAAMAELAHWGLGFAA